MMKGPSLQISLTASQEIQSTSRSPPEWIGHLVPTSTDSFIVSPKSMVQEDQPLPIVLDDTTILFATLQADPTNL